jgi:plasmid rolling circle replication initiator protein Rep
MFTIYYNKKITKLQLKLFNYLAEEHNPALEFLINFLYSLLEKSIKIAEIIKDILIVPIFQVISLFIMLILLLFNVITSNPITTIHTNTAFINSTVINIAETNFKSHILSFINKVDNIPPPITLEEEIQPNKAVKIENEIKVVEEKAIDEIESIINPYVREATQKKREQLQIIDNFKGTLIDLDKIKNCAVDLTIPSNSKPFIHYCKNRFCPTCANIKATKNADIIKKVLFKARENKKTLLYGTFTTKNVTADNLTAEIEKINTAFTKTLTVPKKMKNIVGYVKKLEIKYNPIQQDYNVHIHTVIAVSNYYKNHISIDEYHEYFKKYTKDNDIIKPDIKVIGDTDKDITKVANYISKEDLIQNLLFADEVSDNIFNAVKNKRLLEFCLSFRELKKESENVIDLNKINKNKNKLPLLTTLTWDNNKKIYIN